MRVAGAYFGAVAEESAAIRRPRHLKIIVGPLDAFDAQARTKAMAGLQVGDELAAGDAEAVTLLGGQRREFTQEARQRIKCGHP